MTENKPVTAKFESAAHQQTYTHTLAQAEAGVRRTLSILALEEQVRPRSFEASLAVVESAAQTLTAIRSYEYAPGPDSIIHLYVSALRPVLQTVVPDLNDTRTPEGLAALCAGYLAVAEQKRTSGQSTVYQTILHMGEEPDTIVDALREVARLKVDELVNTKQPDLAASLRGVSYRTMQEHPATKAASALHRFMELYPAPPIASGDTVAEAKQLNTTHQAAYHAALDEAKQHIDALIARRGTAQRDAAQVVTWLFDTAASIVESLKAKEYKTLQEETRRLFHSEF